MILFWPSSACFDQFWQVALAQIQQLMGFSGGAVYYQRCGVSRQLLCGAGAGGSHGASTA